MHALVIYESMFGNTKEIAEAIAQGLAATAEVDVTEVDSAPTPLNPELDLVVIGGPTHAFGMSRPTTRRDARTERATVSTGDGIREWIAAIGPDSARVSVAAFDTKISKPRLPGSAARGAARALKRAGFLLLAPAKTFYVDGKTGPLLTGETDRARAWGRGIAALAGKHAPRR